MTQEALKQMYQLLLTEPHAPTVCAQLERIAREALAEHAMRETQRLGQEIEQCQCPECQIKPHASDCAVHSEPAYPKGKCDCGAQPPPWWPAVENILAEYGLQAIDFVADFKQALAQTEQDGDCKKCKDGCPACDARKIPNDLL